MSDEPKRFAPEIYLRTGLAFTGGRLLEISGALRFVPPSLIPWLLDDAEQEVRVALAAIETYRAATTPEARLAAARATAEAEALEHLSCPPTFDATQLPDEMKVHGHG